MLSLVLHWGDIERGLVMLAPLLVFGVLQWLLRRRRMTRPWGRPVRSERYSLRKLAAVLVIVLIGDAAARLGGIVLPVSGVVGNLGFFVAMVMFLIWFYRARVNAEGHGWPQRLSPGWAIGAWFVPLVSLWFPFWIMVDIWRAGLPEQARTKIAILPVIWWASVLAFLYLLVSDVPTGPPHPAWHVSMPLYGTWVLAAITTALLVQKVSRGPVGLKDGDRRLVPSVVNPPKNRERAGNAPLRDEIAARVCFETTLDRASFLGTGGFGGTRGMWIRLRGPKRLIVGTDAFMVSAPQAFSEFVFRGSESSIAFGQAWNPDDCIMITGHEGGGQVQLAITGRNLPDIWQALTRTGAALVLCSGRVSRCLRFRFRRDGKFVVQLLGESLVLCKRIAQVLLESPQLRPSQLEIGLRLLRLLRQFLCFIRAGVGFLGPAGVRLSP